MCVCVPTQGKCDPPGPISNRFLYDDETGSLMRGLEAGVDYRAVNPTVWYLYLELYGTDGSSELCRYVVDLYEKDVIGEHKRMV